MKATKEKKVRRIKSKHGKGLLNKLIDLVPVELHVPGYQYCGPGDYN